MSDSVIKANETLSTNTITITDPTLVALLQKVNGAVELKSPTGEILGQFATQGLYKLPPGVKSPFTEEELVELRKQRTGRPLNDILRELQGRK